MRRVRFLVAAIAAFAAFAGTPVQADDRSVQEAIAQVQKETQGKILSVQTLRIGKKKVYRIKVLTPEAQIRIVQVPAER
jgi:hypothetical protein